MLRKVIAAPLLFFFAGISYLFSIDVGMASPVETYWKHNNSIMKYISDDVSRVMKYYRPKSELGDLVAPDQILYHGERHGDAFIGTAYTFKGGCEPMPFDIGGEIKSDEGFTLRGRKPVRNWSCEVTGYEDTELKFTKYRFEEKSNSDAAVPDLTEILDESCDEKRAKNRTVEPLEINYCNLPVVPRATDDPFTTLDDLFESLDVPLDGSDGIEVDERESAEAAEREAEAARREAEANLHRVNITIVNHDSYDAGFRFYAANFAWPAGDRQWTVGANDSSRVTLECKPYQKICYGAWRNINPRSHWAKGTDRNAGCTECCVTCGTREMTFSLGKGDSETVYSRRNANRNTDGADLLGDIIGGVALGLSVGNALNQNTDSYVPRRGPAQSESGISGRSK